MKITIEISEVVEDAFRDNMNLGPGVFDRIDPQTLVTAIIKSYLNSSIDREDIDMRACMFMDKLEESGELEDIIYESNLE